MSAPTNKIAAQWLHPIAVPEPQLTPAEMIRRAEALRPLLRERQAQTERNGNMSAETNAELVKAGFYRVLQPRQFGGYEFDFPTYVRVMMAIARGCPETAWVLSIVAGHVGQLASFPIEAQREVYGADGEVRSPEVTAPPGVATPVDGGYLLNGAWDYASGSEYSTHLIVVARVANDQSNADNRTIMALVNRADYTIEKNWHVFGMQGTGSDRVVLNKVFVPDYRTKAVFIDGTRVMPDRDYYSNPMYFGPYRAYVIAESTAVIVGGAEGALDCYEEDFRNRKVAFPTNMYRYEMAEFQLNFGRCRALIDTAKAALIQVAEQYMAAAQAVYAGEQLEPQLERRLCMIEQQTIHLACEAVDIMFRTAGSSNAKHDSMLGRYWRNLCVARGHLAHQSDTSAINFGRAHFGLPTVGIG
jgi:3-hydroxy-9,10-secoandrosta-1,3,5(10)-triene-9,17-dione monooxygenase